MYCYNCMKEINDGNFCKYCGNKNSLEIIPHHLAPGTTLHHKYIIGKCLGEGGFGITYVGLDQVLEKRVAIKEFFPSGNANRNNTVTNIITITSGKKQDFFEKGRKNFLNEARSLAKYDNEDGVVDVIDCFQENNTAYIVMEYLDGINLNDYLKSNGSFDASHIFSLMIPLMMSLDKMHNDGIIHRDISPDNIMYLKNGTLKLMDFGSARYFTNQDNPISIMLKEGYAPEEQYRKNGIQGPWTDVYGLCATIYKCITGETPEYGIDRIHQDNIKLPSELGVNISKSLESVLMYGLAPCRENRCHNMHELIDITKKALSNNSFVATPAYKKASPVTEPNDVLKTKMADEIYNPNDGYINNQSANQDNVNITYGNNKAYSDNYSYSQNTAYNQNQPNNYYNNPAQYNKPKKSKAPIAIAIILGLCILIAGGSLFFAIMGNINKSDSPDLKYTESSFTENNSFSMLSCKGKKISSIKQELEDIGLKVITNYEFNEDTAKDYVIGQEPAEGDTVSKGDTVTLTVSKGSDVCPYSYSQKVVVQAKSGSSYGTLKLFNWEDGKWKEKFKCNCTVGKSGISSTYGEAFTSTPKGTWKLGVVLTSDNYVDTNMDIYYVTDKTGIPYDTRTSYSGYYNQIIEAEDLPSDMAFDQLGKKILNGDNNHLIFIEHNGDGFSSSDVVVGNGSAITICGVAGTPKPTNGCIDITKDNMTKLLKKLDIDKNPYIEIK